MRSFSIRHKGNVLFQPKFASRVQLRLLLTLGLSLPLGMAGVTLTGCGTLGSHATTRHSFSDGLADRGGDGTQPVSSQSSANKIASSGKLSDSERANEQPATMQVEKTGATVASVSYEAPVVTSPSDESYRLNESSYSIPLNQPQVSFGHADCEAPTAMCNSCGTNCSSGTAPCLITSEPQRKNSNEYIFDGGDQEPAVVVKKDWTAAGVDPTDTVIYYETLGGQVCVKPSNRVPIYAPRFAAVRQVTGVTLAARAVGTERMLVPVSPANIRETDLAGNVTLPVAPHGEQQIGMLDAFQENRLGVPMGQVIPPAHVSETLVMFENITFFTTGEMIYDEIPVLGRVLANAREWYTPESLEVVIDGQQAALVVDAKRAQDVHIYEMPDKCAMRICKAASHTIANSGDIVRFTIRFDNVGTKPLGNAVVLDSLSARLEYIGDSQQCSVDAKFSTDANDVGSQVLRWEIEEAINPSEGGVISFDCRVR